MKKKPFRASTIASFVLAALLCGATQAKTQGGPRNYPRMVPLDRYLMADRDEEVALARSAAPDSISHDAEILVLGRHGYETVSKGKNGFVCTARAE